MNKIIAWFATNNVAANLLMGFAVLAGIAALTRITVQLYPDVELPLISINVPYLGAAPEEVEKGVCVRVEQELSGLVGIKIMRSTAIEGMCTVQLELFFDVDATAMVGDVQNRINAIETFPEATEKPTVRLLTFGTLVAEVAVTGPVDERALKELGRRVRDDLLALPEITYAADANTRPYEISVEVSEAALLRNGLTFDDVARAVRDGSADIPGGSIRTEQGEILLRTQGQAYWGYEIENLPVILRPDGSRELVKDVATVIDGFVDTEQTLRFDGEPATLVQVFRVGDEDVGGISDAVRRFVAEAQSGYPEGVKLTLWNDESVVLSDRLGTLFDSGIQGMLLVLVLLTIFLRPHLALWVTAGIPIAFLGAIFLLAALGYSIDTISLIGFILVLGMLVDDAVVVGESVYVAQRSGAGQLAGAIEGSQRVLVPVTFGVLTTAAAFSPMLMTEGPSGEIMAVIGATVLCCLAFSLIECQCVLPAHLGHRYSKIPLGEFGLVFLIVVTIAAFAFTSDTRMGMAVAIFSAAVVWALHQVGLLNKLAVLFTRFQVRCESALTWFINNPFQRIVETALAARRMTLAIAFVAIVVPIAIVMSSHMPFYMMPPAPGDRIVAVVTMPHGINPEVTRTVVHDLVSAGERIDNNLAAEYGSSVVAHVMQGIGNQPFMGAQARLRGEPEPIGSHVGEVILQLTPSAQRPVSTNEIADLWRTETGGIAGDGDIRFITERFDVGNDFHLIVHGAQLAELEAVAEALRVELAEYPGLFDISDSLTIGKRELKLSVTPAGEALGVTLSDLGRQVRQAFYGEEAQRVQRGQDDVRVMVRYPAQQRRSLEALDGLRIQTPEGGKVPFATVATAEFGRGTAAINRSEGQRSVDVKARVDLSTTSANAVFASLQASFLPELLARYPDLGYTYETGRRSDEIGESLGPLFLLALFGIFALLAIPLHSYSQPLIIMTVLPFAFVGAVLGTIFMQLFGGQAGMSLPSIAGVIAACGVVINAALVLMHGVNGFRATGDSLHDALVKAAMSRCRPILITTVTTIAGLSPLMLSDSEAAKTMSPMAVSLGFGVLVASIAALLAMPAFWMTMHDIARSAKRLRGGVVDALGSAPRLTNWIRRYPYLQESMTRQEFTDLELPEDLGLDEETAAIARQGLVRVFYEREFNVEMLRAQLDSLAGKLPLTDDLVSEIRSWAEQKTFQLGVQMSRGDIAPLEAAPPLTRIIDTSLSVLLDAAKREFEVTNERIKGGRIALIALGAAGREELATGSELQLLFLCDHPASSTTTFLDASTWYAQFVRFFARLVGDLAPERMLLDEVTFRSYPQREASVEACNWSNLLEHFADEDEIDGLRELCHARVITAEEGLGAEFESMRSSLLSKPRVADAVKRELSQAREALLAAEDAVGDWDVWSRPGGLADLHLAAEYLQLTAAADESEMFERGLVTVLVNAQRLGLLDERVGADLVGAATLWQNLNGFFRMTVVGAYEPRSASDEQTEVLVTLGNVDDLESLKNKIAEVSIRTAGHIETLLATSETAEASGNTA